MKRALQLRIDHLQVKYGKHLVIRELTLPPLEAGSVVGVVGPNGSCKSTLVKTIAGVHKPSHGSVSVNLNGASLSGSALRQIVGYMPQDISPMVSLTAFDMVLINARKGSQPVQRTARMFEELGLGALAHAPMSELSGGQRQMVALAQMLVAEPPIMLLDEPTSALDLRWQLFVLDTLRRRASKNGALAIVVLHDMNLAARSCDTLAVMQHGELIEYGAPSTVLTQANLRNVYGVRAHILQCDNCPIIAPQQVVS